MVSFCHVTEIKLISRITKTIRAKNAICIVAMDKFKAYQNKISKF